jgi:hypothetical protein
LTADLADVAAGIGAVEPSKASRIHAQLKAQRCEKTCVGRFVLLKLGPKCRLGHAVQVLAGQEQAEELGQCWHLRQLRRQWMRRRHSGMLTR